MPTPALEEYLETIYKLGQQGPVRPTQIADAVGVSGPTVTATLKRLESHGLVRRDGTEVVLTELGIARSLEIVRKHRIAERFLVDVLGLDWEAAHEDACLLEHALSGRVLEALEAYLDNPEVCPHGHPIPHADGSMPDVSGRSLAEFPVGAQVRILRVAEDEDVLGYLGSLQLVPGARLTVVAVEPAGGLMTIRVGAEDRVLALGVARHVTVVEDRS